MMSFYPTCHTCKEYIDAHKCNVAVEIDTAPRPFYRNEDLEKISNDRYWFGCFVWFMLRHRRHEVDILCDESPEYWENCEDYTEKFTHKGDLEKMKLKDYDFWARRELAPVDKLELVKVDLKKYLETRDLDALKRLEIFSNVGQWAYKDPSDAL